MGDYILEFGAPAKLTTAEAIFTVDDTTELNRALAMGVKSKLAMVACFGPYVVAKDPRGPSRVVDWHGDMESAELMLDGYVTDVRLNGESMYKIKTIDIPTIDSIRMPGLYSYARLSIENGRLVANYTTKKTN